MDTHGAIIISQRYQVGDEICGQVERCGLKGEAMNLARKHLDRHDAEVRVRVVDCMARKNQYRRAWEVWRGSHGGESYRAVTNPELNINE